MKNFYTTILGLTAIVLATIAAYFSVFGLSKLFIGASMSIIIMAGALEFAKIIVVSYLNQYWTIIAKGLKTYLLIGVAVLMIITSMGIYGFLSNAYSKVSTELTKMGGDVELLNKRIEIKKEEKKRLDEQIKTKNDRVISLTNLRKSQETRLDSLYQRGWMAAAKKTETIISQADDNISSLNKEIDAIGKKIENLNDSIAKYETSKLGIGNSDIAAEVGPLKYIAKLTGLDMDTVVNWLTLMLIIVFDPLAVALVIATSSMVKRTNKEKQDKFKESGDVFKKKFLYEPDEQGNFKLQNEDDLEEKSQKNVLQKIKKIFSKRSRPVENNVKAPIVEAPPKEPEKEIIPIIEESPLEEKPIVIEEELPKENKESVKEEENNSQTIVVEPQTVESITLENPTVSKIEESNLVDTKEPSTFSVNQDTIVPSVFTAITSQDETKEAPLVSEEKEIVAEQEQREISAENIAGKQGLYLKLLKIFYDNGNKKNGDEIPSYKELKKSIDDKLPNTSEKDIKDFLLICNLFKITEFKENSGYFEKDYPSAINLVSKI